MAQDKDLTYVFVGDTEVGRRVATSLTQAGFKAAPDADAADVVFTYCATIPALEDVYYDTEGLVAQLTAGRILVDLSPSTVSFARELNTMALVNDAVALDCPLVVRDFVTEDAFIDPANLGIVAGGDGEAYRRVEPMLRAIAGKVMWMGEAGAGQAAKIAITLERAASLVGIVEGYASLASSEVAVEPGDVTDFLSSMGVLTPMQEAFVEAMADESFDGTYTIEHMMGELAAALQSVDDGDLILPQAESGFRLMELLALVGGVSLGPAALSLVFADEEASKRYGLEWERAEGAYEHDHECACGHDHDDDHECCGHHHHDEGPASGYLSFSSN